MQSLTIYIVIGFGVWLLILSSLTIWIILFFKKLSSKVGVNDLISVLKKVFEQESLNSKSVKGLKNEILRIDNDMLSHIQSMGLVKFNPFEEMGGDHSFSLALIDGKMSGFVLTGLHTRERTRIYIKRIRNSKSEHELSKEEEKALRLAIKENVNKIKK